jgi:hypothetical protein
MRVMVLVKASDDSENGRMPSTEELTAMGAYNEQLVKAGVMLDGDGLHPSSKGARVTLSADAPPSVTDGPFAETKELVAGYWVWQVKDMDEAVEWARRAPTPASGPDFNLELRPLFEAEDFGEEYTPEIREQEDRLRKQLEDDGKAS